MSYLLKHAPSGRWYGKPMAWPRDRSLAAGFATRREAKAVAASMKHPDEFEIIPDGPDAAQELVEWFEARITPATARDLSTGEEIVLVPLKLLRALAASVNS